LLHWAKACHLRQYQGWVVDFIHENPNGCGHSLVQLLDIVVALRESGLPWMKARGTVEAAMSGMRFVGET
jgi:hypothetical protein